MENKKSIVDSLEKIATNVYELFIEAFEGQSFTISGYKEQKLYPILAFILTNAKLNCKYAIGVFDNSSLSQEKSKDLLGFINKNLNCCSILTDGVTYYVYDSTGEFLFDIDNFDIIKTFILNNINIDNLKKRLLKDRVQKCTSKYHTLLSFENFEECENGMSFKNKTLENQFWRNLLNIKGVEEPNLFCKYATLDTAYYILTNGTFRVSGIAGMNDKSEIDFFDEYCKTDNSENTNDVFISCGVDDCDNLTMWRLYGDDSKGVCLVFEINDLAKDTFIMHKVEYAKKHIGKYYNEHLDIIKEMNDTGIKFNELNKWKHFFKASEYSIENEIRLLYVNNVVCNRNVTWVKTPDHSILNPVIDFHLKQEVFPLRLKKIVVGSNCPEIDTNIRQIKEMLKINGFDRDNVEVVQSEIKNYR
ncbi:MAG: DUF2971 domain-containing protein [Paludibacteraceae bacterium]|nr:DUF2971 domain-containing protein [Paludibacteraceae bacterium]